MIVFRTYFVRMVCVTILLVILLSSFAGCSPASTTSQSTPLASGSQKNKVLVQLEELIDKGEYEAAARAIKTSSISWEDVVRLFEGHMDVLDANVLYCPVSGVDTKDGVASLNAILTQKMPYYLKYFKDDLSSDDILERSSFSYQNSRFLLQEAIGAAPDGKILVYQKSTIPTSLQRPMFAANNAVLLSATALLDEKYIPASIDEVQYLVLLSYDLQYECTYRNTVVGSKVIASIQLLEYPTETLLHEFATLEGGDLPDRIPAQTAKVVIGTYPGQAEVTEALLEAIKQINENPAALF